MNQDFIVLPIGDIGVGVNMQKWKLGKFLISMFRVRSDPTQDTDAIEFYSSLSDARFINEYTTVEPVTAHCYFAHIVIFQQHGKDVQ
jgi:hypothetical protein